MVLPAGQPVVKPAATFAQLSHNVGYLFARLIAADCLLSFFVLVHHFFDERYENNHYVKEQQFAKTVNYLMLQKV